VSPTLSIHEVAEAEINEAADFYDQESHSDCMANTACSRPARG
jgi:hypothetical protein